MKRHHHKRNKCSKRKKGIIVPKAGNRYYGRCLKCGRILNLTKHHILPKRYFSGGEVALLCVGCHSELETIIFQAEKLSAEVYEAIFTQFIKEDK